MGTGIRFWSATSIPLYGRAVDELHLEINDERWIVSVVDGTPVIARPTCPACTEPAHPHAGLFRLPARFYDDHVARDCYAGVEQRRTKRHVYVELDGAGYCDLRSDAVLYSEGGVGTFGIEMGGLCRSAAATLAALDAGPIPRR